MFFIINSKKEWLYKITDENAGLFTSDGRWAIGYETKDDAIKDLLIVQELCGRKTMVVEIPIAKE